jgi:hypothetical protein
VAGARVHGDFETIVDGIPSWEDPRTWVIFGEEPVMTFKYAALAAQAAYCYRMAERLHQLGTAVDASGLVQQWRTEAVNAFQWATGNTLAGDNVQKERAYASAWLFKLTGESSYQDQFVLDNAVSSSNISKFADMPWSVWAYATTPDSTPGLNTALKADLITACANYAHQEVLDAIERGRSFRQGGNFYMPILVGQQTTPWVMPAIIAYELTKEEKYITAVETTSDYMLGGNSMNMVWVTGLGQEYPTQILNVDWWYGSKSEVIPGVVPYGAVSWCVNMGGADCDWNGPWDPDFIKTTTYPVSSLWPAHEMFFKTRYTPMTNEYTVHQNQAPTAAVYGYLCGADNPRTLVRRPASSPRSR